MFWKSVVEEFGFEMSERMKKSKFLQCITVVIKDNEWNYPRRDIILAYKDITNQYISPLEWD